MVNKSNSYLIKIVSLVLTILSIWGMLALIKLDEPTTYFSPLETILNFYKPYLFSFIAVLSLNLERIWGRKFVIDKVNLFVFVFPLSIMLLSQFIWINQVPIPILIIKNIKVYTAILSALVAQSLVNSLHHND